jgi:hypothetical protein
VAAGPRAAADKRARRVTGMGAPVDPGAGETGNGSTVIVTVAFTGTQ